MSLGRHSIRVDLQVESHLAPASAPDLEGPLAPPVRGSAHLWPRPPMTRLRPTAPPTHCSAHPPEALLTYGLARRGPAHLWPRPPVTRPRPQSRPRPPAGLVSVGVWPVVQTPSHPLSPTARTPPPPAGRPLPGHWRRRAWVRSL